MSKYIDFMLVGILTQVGYGAAFRLPNQDAFVTARGNAYTASAVYYNPAGLTTAYGQYGSSRRVCY